MDAVCPQTPRMLEPISTLTNVAFVIFGLLVIKKDWYVGFIVVLLGIASGGWHYFHTIFWHTFDLSMMYFMLLALLNYSMGSKHLEKTYLASITMVGLHFLVPSHYLIAGLALVLLVSLIRQYPPSRILIIIGCFVLWISTNIPYLHEWNMPFWQLDLLHGISHVWAAIGIYKVIGYKPTTFFELTSSFKSIHLSSLSDEARREYEHIIDLELNPILGKLSVEFIEEKDVSQLLHNISSKEQDIVEGVETKLDEILTFATGQGIKHKLAVVKQ